MEKEVKDVKVEEKNEKVEKVEKEVKNNKNTKIIACILGGIIVVVVVALLLFIFVFKDNKAELNKELENAGRNFYENFYYNQVGKDDNARKEFLSKYATIGIKIDLENLARTSENKDELLNKFVNKKTGEKCNATSTKITIYPKDPFGQKDYTVETTVECGFDK